MMAKYDQYLDDEREILEKKIRKIKRQKIVASLTMVLGIMWCVLIITLPFGIFIIMSTSLWKTFLIKEQERLNLKLNELQ